MANKRKRPQAPKGAKSGNQRYVEGIQELRRSGAAGPHRSANDYRRKPKHTGRGWE